MRRIGHVEISRYDLAAKCTYCGKSIHYRNRIHLGIWKEIVKAFVRKHKDCSTKETIHESQNAES